MTRQLVVEIEPRDEKRFYLNTNWITGQSEDGTKIELTCGAGLGSSLMSLTVRKPDGRTVTEHVNVAKLLTAWATAIEVDMEAEAAQSAIGEVEPCRRKTS